MNLELVNNDEICNRSKTYTRQQLIDKLRQWTKENGRIPLQIDFTNNPKYPNAHKYRDEFGTWNNALIESGIGIRQGYTHKYTRQELIDILQQWIKENGRIPTSTDFNDDPNLSAINTYIREFGSWNKALIETGFKPNDHNTRGRQGELQQISEFKTKGAKDLSGLNRISTCDGICPNGEMFDTKSSSLTTDKNGKLGWPYSIKISQLEEADNIFLRAYVDKDFTKKPLHIWKVPIDFIDNRQSIFIYRDNKNGMYNVENMKKYEIKE